MLLLSCKKVVLLVFVLGLCLDLCTASVGSHEKEHGHHHCDHHHHNHHDHHHEVYEEKLKLPEELAEEEDMKLFGFGPYHHNDHDSHETHLSGLGLWVHALGCSLLVSLASLICLIILPVIFIQGKPSKALVDSLALFGAGAMLGDAFLHQLPHAFGGEHSHSHNDHVNHAHHGHSGHKQLHSHSHSLKDLSVGLSILAGIVLFLLVEKMVRYVEDNSEKGNAHILGHNHHHHKSSKKLKDDNAVHEEINSQSSSGTKRIVSDEVSDDSLNGDKVLQNESLLRKRKTSPGYGDIKSDVDAADGYNNKVESLNEEEASQSPSNLVFGYLNLISDGVHNFTDGMALGSAFLLYGSFGGWSRTIFLLAHELPQEVGDFGILVRSGFSVSKALFFNFLSALLALVGTAMALLLGQDPGQSSLIEGFTAGGFIYIAVAGVLAEMNNNGKTTLRCTAVQLTSLTMGIVVALCISLLE